MKKRIILLVLVIAIFVFAMSAPVSAVINISTTVDTWSPSHHAVSVYRIASPSSIYIGKYIFLNLGFLGYATIPFNTWKGYNYKLYVLNNNGTVSGPYIRQSLGNSNGKCVWWVP